MDSYVSLDPRKALTFLQICTHNLGVEVESWHHHPNMIICNENLVEDELSLIKCSKYKVICGIYNGLLDEHDNASVLECPPARLSTNL